MSDAVYLIELPNLRTGDIRASLELNDTEYRKLTAVILRKLETEELLNHQFKSTPDKERLLSLLRVVWNEREAQRSRKRALNSTRLQILLTLAYRCIRNSRRRQSRVRGKYQQTYYIYSNTDNIQIGYRHMPHETSDGNNQPLQPPLSIKLPTFRVRRVTGEYNMSRFRSEDIILTTDRRKNPSIDQLRLSLFRRHIKEDLDFDSDVHGIFYTLEDGQIEEIKHERAFHTTIQERLNTGGTIVEFTVQERLSIDK